MVLIVLPRAHARRGFVEDRKAACSVVDPSGSSPSPGSSQLHALSIGPRMRVAKSPGGTLVGRVIAVCNQKGGVAKTTTVVSLGAALADLGKKVLLVDLDPQGGLTVCSGFDPDSLQKTVYDALRRGESASGCVLRTQFGPDLVPANIDLSMAEMELIGMVARERRLGAVLGPVRDDYDFVLMDCQPSLGLLAINALAFADEVLIPVACEALALRGARILLRVIGKVRVQLNSKLKITGVLPTMYDARTNHGKRILEEIKSSFQGKIRVFETVINRSVRFAEAAGEGKPVFLHAGAVPGAQAYRELALEVAGAEARHAGA
ncbi:MAG: ParA family protein [Firmicutes bacterium]|nr:ParA family protein [Bacillota bacterium]